MFSHVTETMGHTIAIIIDVKNFVNPTFGSTTLSCDRLSLNCSNIQHVE